MTVNRLPDVVWKLRKALGKLASGDHAVQEGLNERELNSELDAKPRSAGDGLAGGKYLLPVMQDAGNASQVGLNAIDCRKPLCRESHGQRVREPLGLRRKLLARGILVALDGGELVLPILDRDVKPGWATLGPGGLEGLGRRAHSVSLPKPSMRPRASGAV